MKKVYALLAALAVTATAFAAVQRGNDLRVKMVPRSLLSNPIAENLNIAPALTIVKAPAAAGITTAGAADDVAGLYKALFTDSEGSYYHYTAIEATGENTVVINGLYYSDALVPATVDEASGDLVISSGSVVFEGSQYSVFIAAISDDASTVLTDDIVLANAGNGQYSCSQYVGYVLEYDGGSQLSAAFTLNGIELTDEVNTRVIADVYDYG
ncbi:MAG: hypothetical protein ACI30W_07775, partial [Muribaculaceae bacterium]